MFCSSVLRAPGYFQITKDGHADFDQIIEHCCSDTTVQYYKYKVRNIRVFIDSSANPSSTVIFDKASAVTF